MAKQPKDPIFAAFEKSAPRLDLRFYLQAIGRTAPERLKPGAGPVITDMVSLYVELTGDKPGTTAAQRRRVWQIIPRYKALTLDVKPFDGFDCRTFDYDAVTTWEVLDTMPDGAPTFETLARYREIIEPEPWPTLSDDAVCELALYVAEQCAARDYVAVDDIDGAELDARAAEMFA